MALSDSCAISIAALVSCSVLSAAPLPQESKLVPIEILERAISGDPEPAQEETEAMILALQEAPATYGPILFEKIQLPDLSEEALTYYLWGLTFAPWAPAVERLVKLAEPDAPDGVFGNAVGALAATMEEAAGEHLLHLLEPVKEEGLRFFLFSNLAQMQYAPALPKTAEILASEPRFYWQSIFVFGKYGDLAAPFLVEELRKKGATKATKSNALMMLGQWLQASEASGPLLEMFRGEQDAEVRMMILSALSATVHDFDEQVKLYRAIAAEEPPGPVKEHAQMILGQIPGIRKKCAQFAAEIQPDQTVFAAEYHLLYLSAGREGDIEKLGRASSPEDESELKRLRERILTRGSDECFYDYEKITAIIGAHRLADAKGD